MYQRVMAMVVGVVLAACAGRAVAQVQQAPTRAEVEQQAMQQGPSTGRIGYQTRRSPRVAKHKPAPADPKLLQPLTEREVGMLFNACVAYPECKTAYRRAYEHNQALLQARREAGGDGGE